jgi:hypothetical protein
MAKDMNPLERAARTLSIMNGHAEDAMADGKPVWQSYVPEARAALSSAQMNWRPIKSAPLDGTPVLIFVPAEKNPHRQMMVGAWDRQNARWTAVPSVYRVTPTHWLPLPPYPQD